jgi:hypothetical protein
MIIESVRINSSSGDDTCWTIQITFWGYYLDRNYKKHRDWVFNAYREQPID